MTDVRPTVHPADFDGLPSAELRRRLVVEDLFVPGELRWCLSQQDRIMIGGALPAGGELSVLAPDEIRAENLCDRREVGVVCLAGSGRVSVGEEGFELETEDILYVGQGSGTITLSGDAVFYLVSAPAHRSLPTVLIKRDQAQTASFGEAANASRRTIRKYVHDQGVESCELALGITTLDSGSVWNTMPCHTHDRRTEVYLYFNVPADERVFHIYGQPQQTRSVVLADRQAVINPPWSVHFGAGTTPYSFVWSTAGENLAYNDMDPVPTSALA